MEKTHLITVLATGDRKTGPVGATYRSIKESCPPGCGIAEECYAGRGRVNLIQRRAAHRHDSIWRLSGLPYIRHLISGDLFKRTTAGGKVIDRRCVREIGEFHRHPAQRNTLGWIYSHGAEKLARAGFGPDWWPKNCKILASCETVADAARLQAQGWVTARVTTVRDRQQNEVYCPYDLQLEAGRVPDTNCQKCRLCFDGRKNNIVFLLQDGTRKKGGK